MAPKDWKKALQAADGIPDGWYKCQALAQVAQICPLAKQQGTILKNAFKAGLSSGDPNRVVTASAWPLRVLAETGKERAVQEETTRLLEILKKEANPTRRMDALVEVVLSLVASRSSFLKALQEFEVACREANSWKGPRAIARVLPFVAQVDPARASQLSQLIADAKERQKLERDLANSTGNGA
jgi:hypothetical protein